MVLYFQVEEKYHKKRLDEFIFDKFPFLSRIYLKKLIRDGKCQVNGQVENRGYILRKNDFLEVEIDYKENLLTRPEPIDLQIIHENQDFLIVNKPSGMLVHPTLNVHSGTLLNGLAYYLNKDSNNSFIRPGLVHRLDKETSGLMIVAKNKKAHQILSRAFERRIIEKKYFALVEGIIKSEEGIIEAPIGKYEDLKQWNIKPDGKIATTIFRTKQILHDKTLLELEPLTGRTNQLRIHLAYFGHPIVGDEKYGGRKFKRLCLHAYKLAFSYEKNHFNFQTPIPEDFEIEAQMQYANRTF
jgi:23S rRNA pseudouridine1911/1915/1917 synthase